MLRGCRADWLAAGLIVRLTALLGIVLVLAGCGQTAAAAEDARLPGRSYRDGPLTADDYQAEPAEDSPLAAFTVSDVRWDYRYRYQSTNRTATAFLSELTVDAVVIAAQSWNRRPKDKRLLDHEQGHFDLTLIAALQTRLLFAEEYQTRKLTATGATAEIAVENLRRRMEQELRSIRDRLLADQVEYDRVTRHGLERAAQAEQRKSQLATLQKLTAELEKREAKRSP